LNEDQLEDNRSIEAQIEREIRKHIATAEKKLELKLSATQ